MGYLDYAGLQYLWGKLKEKFAPKSHSHDDRYYTEAEMDGKLNSKSNTNHTHDASTLINALGTGAAAPTDPDYIITQWVGGGTSNTTWVRRPMSSIWNYIKSKADGVYQPKGSYAASGHTHDDRYYTEAEVNSKLEAKASSDHTHGLNSSSLTKSVDNTTTNSWDMVGGNKDFLLRSLRMQAKAPDWLEDNYAAGIAFGGADTKGVISHAYNAPDIKFAGGNGAAPVWWLRLTGTSGKTYNLNAMPPASHTHTKDQVGLGNVDNTADKNKSVNYATSAGLATNAQCLNNDDKYMKFHWSGQKGQPTWLWGGNDSGDMYVYNPSNFNVNYATTAGNGTVGFQTKVTTDGYFGAVRFGNGVQICWFTMKSTRNRTFLLPFADINYAIAFSGGYCWLNINNRTTTGFTVGVEWSGYENSYIAIGRWK